MTRLRHFQIPEVQYRFKVSNVHAYPENILYVVLNKTTMNKLGWDKSTKIKIFIPKPFSWTLFLFEGKEGYTASNYCNKYFYRFKWDNIMPPPKSYMYSKQRSRLIKAQHKERSVCVINLSKNQTWK